jgi:hypothetical protein
MTATCEGICTKEDEEEVGHSKLGVASFLIAIGNFITCVQLVLISIKLSGNVNPSEFEKFFMIFTIYFVLLTVPAAHFIGMILGAAGCLQNKRRKSLAIAGFIINLGLLFIYYGTREFFGGLFLRG